MKIQNWSDPNKAPIASPGFVGDVQAVTPITSDNSTKAATKAFVQNAVQAYSNYYRNCYNVQTVATNGGWGTALAFNASGDLYWAVNNHFNGTTRNVTSYVYKITPAGSLTTFASQATTGAGDTALVFDTSGNLYWAVSNYYNGTTYNLTSYVYKITPAGVKTTFASQATNGGVATDLAFDTSGNLYWAISNERSGATFLQTSYVYKITPAGSLTTFASQSTTGGYGVALAFDTSGNLYWAVNNHYDGTTFNLTSYVYKITPAGSLTTFASQSTSSAKSTSLVFDTSGDLYWAVSNHYDGTTYDLTSYVYKITPAGSLTTFASHATTGGYAGYLTFDTTGNLYWAISNYFNGATYNLTSYVYKITPAGLLTTFASQASKGGYGNALAVNTTGDITWAAINYYNNSVFNLDSYLHQMVLHSAT